MTYACAFLLVVALTAIVNACYAKYTLAVGARHGIATASWSAGITLTTALVVVFYVQDRSYIVAAMLGAFAGTFLTVRSAR